MIILSNRKIIQKKNPSLYNDLSTIEDGNFKNVLKEISKSGKPTLKIRLDEEFIYLHSKYDPEREAKDFIGKIEISKNIRHVFFIGTGLGYHINQILKLNKNLEVSIYEPNIEVLYNFLAEINLEKLLGKRLINIFTDITQIPNTQSLVNRIGVNSKTITLPITEKINNVEIDSTLENILDVVKNKHSEVITNAKFQKRWVVNSLKNFSEVLNTPNMLINIEKEKFLGKPAILVAAGPSLTYEIEHLKYIKEHGLAYIFSVGSAVNALIENGIIPDAACTYDPSERNQLVFQKIKNRHLQNVPMVFGSSVGFETIENYPGPMVHMITSQDTIAASLLDKSLDIDIVQDSPSIAIITFQLLTLLKVSKVILVGQNFCFVNNERYAKGISYSFIGNELSDVEKEQTIQVEGVDGLRVYTSKGFLKMKQNLEYYILRNPQLLVINTTQLGAKIKGTKYKLLENVIKEDLNEKNIVHSDWYDAKSTYNYSFTLNKLKILEDEFDKVSYIIEKCLKNLNQIEKTLDKNLINNLEKLYIDFDNEFFILKQNVFYKVLIEPMIRVQNQVLSEKSKDIKYELNTRKKAKLVLESFGNFLEVVRLNHNFVTPIFNNFIEDLKEKGVYNEE